MGQVVTGAFVAIVGGFLFGWGLLTGFLSIAQWVVQQSTGTDVSTAGFGMGIGVALMLIGMALVRGQVALPTRG